MSIFAVCLVLALIVVCGWMIGVYIYGKGR